MGGAAGISGWFWLDEPWLALAGPTAIFAKLLLAKGKAIALVLGARVLLGAAGWLPKRAVNIVLWVAAGSTFRRTYRHYRWRLRAAVRARKGWATIGLIAALFLAGAMLLLSYVFGITLLALFSLPVGLAMLVWRAIRYGLDWLITHTLGRLSPQELVPDDWRRTSYRWLLKRRREWRARLHQRRRT